MTDQPLLFTADRRSIQGTIFHFSDRPSGAVSGRGFSQQDTLTWNLEKIYENKFPDTIVNSHLRGILVSILVSEVPLTYRNLTLLAAANWIVYHMKSYYRINEITPQLFTPYFNLLAPILLSDVTGKTPQESQEVRANFKVTLLRYVFYIQKYTNRLTAPAATQ